MHLAGRMNELTGVKLKTEFGFGCDLDQCTPIEVALKQIEEFARRP
jgi:hypothetical protein